MAHADSLQNMGGLIVDRIPKPRISAMDNLLTGFNFIVSLNEFTYGFQNVSNIQRHREVGYHMEGGVNDHQIMVGRPNDNIYTLSLRRGYIIHAPDDVINKFAVAGVARIDNETARKAALISINCNSPQAALENGPAPGFIQVYSRRKKLVAMFSFLSLGMIDWTFSDLDAQSSDALFENITIAHTGLTLLPATWLPSAMQYSLSFAPGKDNMDTMTEIMEKNKKEFEKRQKKIQELEKQKKALDEEKIGLLHKRDELLAERAKKAEEKKKKVEKAKEEQAEANAEALKARQEEAKKSEEARKESEKAKEEQAKANAEALKARQEEAKKSEEARKESEKAKEEQAKANAEALKARQEQQKADYERRMEAQQGRTEKQNKQDQASTEKVHESTEKAEQNMKNENDS